MQCGGQLKHMGINQRLYDYFKIICLVLLEKPWLVLKAAHAFLCLKFISV